MVRNLVSYLALCVVMVVAVVALSAQGGRGTPQPLSTSPFDVWSGDKLDDTREPGQFRSLHCQHSATEIPEPRLRLTTRFLISSCSRVARAR